MADPTATQIGSTHSPSAFPAETIFGGWLSALDAAPPGYCGPIYIR